MALQEVLNSSIWVIKDDKSNYQPLYGQFLYTLNTNASGDDDNGVLYVGNGTEWINVMGTALQDVIENILATVPFEQIDNKTIFDAINEKADKATTLEGYGIEDAYTKTTIDAIILALEAELAGKQDKLTAGDNIFIDSKNKISVTGLTKDSVGLGNVDNTSDTDKPVSSATQEALDLKADKSQVANISTDGNTTKIEGNLEVSELDTGEGGSIMTGTLVAHGQVDVDSISVGMSSPLDSVATHISSDSKDTEIPTAKATYTFTKSAVSSLEAIVADKQNKTDDNLTTTNKTIVGAINEVAGDLGTKQDKLTAGDNISIDSNTISVTGVYTSEQVDKKLATKADATSLDNKQDKLIAGTNIAISDTNEISVTGLTKASVGLGNVDNTSDANKPISTATQEALDKKQNKLTAGDGITIDETTNTISATGTGSGTVKSVNSVEPDDNGNVAITTANIPNLGISEDGKTITIGDKSIEPLTSDSTIAANKIEGVVAEATKATQDGNGDVISTTYAKATDLANKQDKLTAGANITITGATISATDTTYTAGTNVSISDANVISATDTKYTAGTNIAISAANEISVTGLTKSSVGLDNVDNTSDADKPISTATQTALDLKADKTQVANISTNETVTTISGSLHTEELDTGETGSISTGTLVAHGQVDVLSITVGSSGVINSIATSVSASSTDTEIPTAKATYTFTKNAVGSLETIVSGKQDKLTAGDNITLNGNTISATDTKYTAGTGINISDDNVITATGGVAGTVTSVNNITPDDGGNVSLGVENIPGAYSETQATTDLAAKQDKSFNIGEQAYTVEGLLTEQKGALDQTYIEKANNGIVIKGQVVIPLTADSEISAAKITGLTKSSVGLGNVDNTSDVDKPISTATQVALNDKQDKLSAGANITISDTNEISATDTTYTAGANVTISASNVISATDTKYTAGTNIAISESNEISVTGLTKASVGLGNVDNTSDADKPISDATQTALDAKQDVANLVTSFGVTPSDEKYPSEKLVNDALNQTNQRVTGVENDTQALSTSKQDKLTAGTNITISGTTISAKDTTYTAGTNITISNINEISATDTKYTAGTNIAIGDDNEISVTGVYTSEQVDEKLATKADSSSLDDKQDKLTAGTNIAISESNEISVTGLTKASVGLGNVDNTSDVNKPISSATQTALDLKQDVDNLVTAFSETPTDTKYPSEKLVYDSIENVHNTVDGELATKANEDATNITGDNVTKWKEALEIDVLEADLDAKQNKAIDITGITAKTVENALAELNTGLAGKQATIKAGSNISIGSDGVTINVSGVVPEATKATQDGNGNTISSWYATTGDLESKQNKLTAGDNIEIDVATSTISVTGIVPSAQVANQATKATEDGNGNNIAETYATIGDVQSKQDFNLVTTIDSTSDDTHYPSAKAVYDFAQASVTSTVETTVTPTTAQTATAITNSLAKKARVVVIPSLANVGAIYIKESDTYSSINPIYPDPTNNVYEFTNMQNVKVFVDSVGDSVDLVIEYRG